MAKLIQVIEVEACRGAGIAGDPHRTVRQFWTPEGVLLIEHDEWKALDSVRRLTEAYLIACQPDEDNCRSELTRIARVIDGKPYTTPPRTAPPACCCAAHKAGIYQICSYCPVHGPKKT